MLISTWSRGQNEETLCTISMEACKDHTSEYELSFLRSSLGAQGWTLHSNMHCHADYAQSLHVSVLAASNSSLPVFLSSILCSSPEDRKLKTLLSPKLRTKLQTKLLCIIKIYYWVKKKKELLKILRVPLDWKTLVFTIQPFHPTANSHRLRSQKWCRRKQ